MEISAYLHTYADASIRNKQQAIIKSFAKALEIIPRQLCDNAGFDATDILNRLRVEHRKGHVWAGVDFDNEGVRNNLDAFVWEPALVKVNAIQAAVEASCLILSVDETISMLSFFFFAQCHGVVGTNSEHTSTFKRSAQVDRWLTQSDRK